MPTPKPLAVQAARPRLESSIVLNCCIYECPKPQFREKREARREVRRELRDSHWRSYSDGGWHDSRNDDDLLKGLAIGAAVVGVGAAIANFAEDKY